MNIYNSILRSVRKQFAVLVDPDKYSAEEAAGVAEEAQQSDVDFLFVGGSLITFDSLQSSIETIRTHCNIPIVLFPGSVLQINEKADGILLLSVISGRNADLLIGKHVIAAPYLRNSGLEILPTGYMIIDSDIATSAQYISNTMPIPREKDDIAVCTAMAGEMLGLKLIYLDAGSGANIPVSSSMISEVKRHISIPLVVGGGIRTPEQAFESCSAGADLVVVGNAIEKNSGFISEIAKAVHSASQKIFQ
jgi:phosphoglycerol geranylgeranyltransferase